MDDDVEEEALVGCFLQVIEVLDACLFDVMRVLGVDIGVRLLGLGVVVDGCGLLELQAARYVGGPQLADGGGEEAAVGLGAGEFGSALQSRR
ncbi:hypothetical protein ABZS29_06055 [Kribbella sp. NPDC005582]|uniref:hypothetical protein n=1 Tax=Kribbella sp. NPDC005582 TaxID=3156893 RepID=UPI0033A2B87B